MIMIQAYECCEKEHGEKLLKDIVVMLLSLVVYKRPGLVCVLMHNELDSV